MKIKTSELTGPALDWAVAMAEGHNVEGYTYLGGSMFDPLLEDWWRPSTDWAQAGPIIEREMLNLECPRGNQWVANVWLVAQVRRFAHGQGDTALIAAMRCYVESKLGDEVDIPEEL